MSPFKKIQKIQVVLHICTLHTERVKNFKFIKKCVFWYSLPTPKNPILLQGHPAEVIVPISVITLYICIFIL